MPRRLVEEPWTLRMRVSNLRTENYNTEISQHRKAGDVWIMKGSEGKDSVVELRVVWSRACQSSEGSRHSARIIVQTNADGKLHADFEESGSSFDYSTSSTSIASLVMAVVVNGEDAPDSTTPQKRKRLWVLVVSPLSSQVRFLEERPPRKICASCLFRDQDNAYLVYFITAELSCSKQVVLKRIRGLWI
ncbi:hypothetical protein DY000_02058259 [Brassica cretica]|uniref:Uncharacterized protein n=1 Tax=Brassica cretica TaxID=69181 RepID=A0ABQ7AHT8_BRACR|nr:hypothetical protein DY000_02058259 [Brassica cretica]